MVDGAHSCIGSFVAGASGNPLHAERIGTEADLMVQVHIHLAQATLECKGPSMSLIFLEDVQLQGAAVFFTSHLAKTYTYSRLLEK